MAAIFRKIVFSRNAEELINLDVNRFIDLAFNMMGRTLNYKDMSVNIINDINSGTL